MQDAFPTISGRVGFLRNDIVLAKDEVISRTVTIGSDNDEILSRLIGRMNKFTYEMNDWEDIWTRRGNTLLVHFENSLSEGKIVVKVS